MTVLAPAVVEPANNPRVRTGLLASALPFPEGTRWHGGISYRPINGVVPVAGESTFYPCNSGFEIGTEDTGPVTWEPWGLALGDECLAGSTEDEDERLRAETRMERQTDYLVGRTFWTGDVGTGTFASLSAPNRALADTDSDDLTTTGPVGVVTAFSRAIQYLADTVGNLRGMIHVAPKLLPFLGFYGVAIREGFQIVTNVADHLVVSSTGYDGSSPNGEPDDESSTWIYVTSMVRAAVSQTQVFNALNRANNDLESRAIRLAIAEWDLQAHGAIQVCLPDPGPSCTEVPS